MPCDELVSRIPASFPVTEETIYRIKSIQYKMMASDIKLVS